ncbi:hypothetical protein QBC36DRAFT_169899, partial [Triangularia setosa]
PDDSGRLRSIQGALLPEGYQQNHLLPGRPWVCPFQSCCCPFTALTELEKHFRV